MESGQLLYNRLPLQGRQQYLACGLAVKLDAVANSKQPKELSSHEVPHRPRQCHHVVSGHAAVSGIRGGRLQMPHLGL